MTKEERQIQADIRKIAIQERGKGKLVKMDLLEWDTENKAIAI